MRNFKIVLLLVVAMTGMPTLAAETKIAVVDLGAAIFSSDLAKKRQTELQAQSDYAALQAKYDSAAVDFKALQKDAEKKRLTWSAEDATEYQKKMEYLRADIELTGRKLESEVRGLQNRIAKELQPTAVKALQELVKQEGITVLLRSENVLHIAPEMNLTAKLTDRLNKKTK